jgi:hypothetical protein
MTICPRHSILSSNKFISECKLYGGEHRVLNVENGEEYEYP